MATETGRHIPYTAIYLTVTHPNLKSELKKACQILKSRLCLSSRFTVETSPVSQQSKTWRPYSDRHVECVLRKSDSDRHKNEMTCKDHPFRCVEFYIWGGESVTSKVVLYIHTPKDTVEIRPRCIWKIISRVPCRTYTCVHHSKPTQYSFSLTVSCLWNPGSFPYVTHQKLGFS